MSPPELFQRDAAAVLAPSGAVDDPGTAPVLVGLLAVGAALVAMAVTEWPLRRTGREQVWAGGSVDAAFGPGSVPVEGAATRRVDHSELAEMATTEFVPPEGLTAAQGGVVNAEQVRDDHRVAWLIEAALRGEIELTEKTKGTKGFIMTWGPRPPAPGSSETLVRMFAGRDRVNLGAYDEEFSAGWKAIGGDLERWRRGSGLWDPRGRTRRTVARVAGVALAVVGLGVLALGAVAAGRTGAWLIAVVVGAAAAGVGAAMVVRSWELLVRTPRGSGAWIRTESFRRFIADSEARHAQMAAEMGVLREYTAWAVALGEVEHWAAVVDAAGIDAAPGVVGNDLAFVAMAPHIGSAAGTASTRPSSSGGGFGGGGGGGVGGGGGGGGGGSW